MIVLGLPLLRSRMAQRAQMAVLIMCGGGRSVSKQTSSTRWPLRV
jgi:hypothetical protein